MNSTNISSHASQHLSGIGQGYSTSRVFDTAGWTFNRETRTVPSLAFLPILGLILLVVCVLMKVYSWCRDSARLKARGDVEFGDEAEANYGIIHAGDKGFCQIDIRADGASLYDTVNSIRFLGNGFATQLSESHPYHDTVTSYKSLLMQKADGSQYDSVKSYKAFLQKVTQHKDLAVEVKLLENYPIRSKSAEHCVVLEEESSEKSEEVATRMLGTLPLKYFHQPSHCSQFDRKKTRTRRASGDPPAAMRKRSASNPTSRRTPVPVGSLPSVRYPLSSDSDEDDQQAFKVDRKKLWAQRKKMSRSSSGPRIFKDQNWGTSSTSWVPDTKEGQNVQKRRRHYSADSARRPKKAAITVNKDCGKYVHNDTDLKGIKQTRLKDHNKLKQKQVVHAELEESSSENPHSSHSSCNSDVQSDVMASESDEDTRQNTLLSNASDDQTMENDVFFSLDSGAELASSMELLESPRRPLSETRKLIARAKEEFFLNKEERAQPIPEITTMTSSSASPDNPDTSSTHNLSKSDQVADIDRSPLSISQVVSADSSPGLSPLSAGQVSTENQRPPERTEAFTEPRADGDTHGRRVVERKASDLQGSSQSQGVSSPRIIQRFHVTFVNADLSSLNSE